MITFDYTTPRSLKHSQVHLTLNLSTHINGCFISLAAPAAAAAKEEKKEEKKKEESEEEDDDMGFGMLSFLLIIYVHFI